MSGSAIPAVPPWAISLQNGGRRASSGDVSAPQQAADTTLMSMPDLNTRAHLVDEDASYGSSAHAAIDNTGEDEDEVDDSESDASGDLTEAGSPEPAQIMSDIAMDAGRVESKQLDGSVRVHSEPTTADKSLDNPYSSRSRIRALEDVWKEQHVRDLAAQNYVAQPSATKTDTFSGGKAPPSKKRRISVSSSSGSDIPDFLPEARAGARVDRGAAATLFPETKRIKFGESNGRAFVTNNGRMTDQDLQAAVLASNRHLSDPPYRSSMGGTPDSDVKLPQATAKASSSNTRTTLESAEMLTDDEEEEDFEDEADDAGEEDEGDDVEEEDIAPSRVDSAVTEERLTPNTAQQHNSALAVAGVIPEQLFHSADGRLYTTFPGAEGVTGKTNGAVFPTGYKMYNSAVTPFICAVRDCQRLLPNVMSLGAHLGAKHRRQTFNDNHDGTMSFLGSYTTPKGISAPPIIVSRNPIGPDAPPPEEAMVPAYVMGRIREAQEANEKSHKRSDRAKMMSKFKYPSSATPPAFDEASLLKVAKKLKPVKFPVGTPTADGYSNQAHPHREPAKQSTPSTIATSTASATENMPDSGARSTRRAAIQANAAIQAASMMHPQPQVNSTASQPRAPPRAGTGSDIQRPQSTQQMLLTAGNVIPANVLEMEEWEIAPGRIRDDAGIIKENIAFSNSFVASTQEIPISSDVSFNVLTIKPGGSVQFEANIGKLRVCSLAAGKLQVKIGSHDFAIGPNGMFKIRDGDSAVVTNRLYLDSVLHVSSIKEY